MVIIFNTPTNKVRVVFHPQSCQCLSIIIILFNFSLPNEYVFLSHSGFNVLPHDIIKFHDFLMCYLIFAFILSFFILVVLEIELLIAPLSNVCTMFCSFKIPDLKYRLKCNSQCSLWE
jgi:hypothetical protein